MTHELTVISSLNGKIGLPQALQVLRDGGSAVDAVETGIRIVESNADDHSVGLGGYPNILGDVELDAGLMEGEYLTSGAVAAVKTHQHPISIARKVMENLPHVFLVGQGAERFAREMGFEDQDLLTQEAVTTWQQGLLTCMPKPFAKDIHATPELWRWVEMTTDPQLTHGTTNFIALDSHGTLAA
ncbi:MAG: isoaspartyl peptidase/L-asparaginase, partial [Anaerolineae bacterium]|nr:isoaspartyl peptidase/L-asparaginase [Anaerolineae bacterium]